MTLVESVKEAVGLGGSSISGCTYSSASSTHPMEQKISKLSIATRIHAKQSEADSDHQLETVKPCPTLVCPYNTEIHAATSLYH